ncbi:MAG: sodium:solute symporter family protein [Deltaproteobacteria bacterium]|jgi:SSS family solute:Na+ symporter
MTEARDLAGVVGVTLAVYVLGMYALAFFAQSKISTEEDFLVAGRRLPLSLAWATLLATWFGAGTMLTAADEVRVEGLRAAALEPLGTGVCLMVAGMFFAAPLWRMKLLTVSDFYRDKFGRRAELLSAIIMVPGYFGWTAAQFLALAGLLELFFGLDPSYGVLIVAVVGTGYTLLGGMWSVTLTDALQVTLLLVGLVVLGWITISDVGVARIVAETPPEMKVLVPTEDLHAFVGWVGVFAIGVFGNLPGQDLMQRVFAAKSETVAKQACWLAGIAYVVFGMIPVGLALASRIMLPGELTSSILPALAHAYLSPVLAVIFTVVLASAVLSTIDSAMLSPSSVMAQNIFPRFVGERFKPLVLNRMALMITAAASLVMAYLGEDAYSLLEDAYALGLVGLLVPLAAGLYREPKSEASALWCMAIGSVVWLVHRVAGWETFLAPALGDWPLPVALCSAGVGLVAYFAADR